VLQLMQLNAMIADSSLFLSRMPWLHFPKEGRRHWKRGKVLMAIFQMYFYLNFYHTNTTLNDCHLTQLSRTSFFCFLFYTHFPEVSVSFSCFIFMTPMPLEKDNAFLDCFCFSFAAFFCQQLIAQVDFLPFSGIHFLFLLLSLLAAADCLPCWLHRLIVISVATWHLVLFWLLCFSASIAQVDCGFTANFLFC